MKIEVGDILKYTFTDGNYQYEQIKSIKDNSFIYEVVQSRGGWDIGNDSEYTLKDIEFEMSRGNLRLCKNYNSPLWKLLNGVE